MTWWMLGTWLWQLPMPQRIISTSPRCTCENLHMRSLSSMKRLQSRGTKKHWRCGTLERELGRSRIGSGDGEKNEQLPKGAGLCGKGALRIPYGGRRSMIMASLTIGACCLDFLAGFPFFFHIFPRKLTDYDS